MPSCLVRRAAFAGLAGFSLCLFAAVATAADPPEGAASPEASAPPEGFGALFNGKDLAGWVGMTRDMDPKKFRAMPPKEQDALLAKNWEEVLKHWSVENGEIVNDGNGPYLSTGRDYGDFELHIEYKTVPKADSGIYLRGVPQVQIWDSTPQGGKGSIGAEKGSGGLFNNKTHAKDPLVLADKPFGEWNAFRIRMIGDTVSVWLNDKLVVDETTMENYFDRESLIYPLGPIELQTHGGEIRFRNVFIKEIPRKPPEAGYLDRAGKPVGDGWQPLPVAQQGKPTVSEAKPGDFDLHLLFTPSGKEPATVAFRVAGDDALTLSVSTETGVLLMDQNKGESATLAETPVAVGGFKPDGENHLYLRAVGDRIQAWLNDAPVADVLYPQGVRSGVIRLSGLTPKAAFLRDLKDEPRPAVSQDETGFEPIYAGDLSGWTTQQGFETRPNSFTATKGSGNVYTKAEYGDFTFRFDFKFDAGANNGVGVRAPLGGDSAYKGMEIQILDNTSPQYANLQPYQYHGSVYGIAPAKRGYLNPVGQWNSEEITMQGRHVTVALNGKTIVDADLDAASKDGTADHRDHPGVKRESGHLGFLGHGHELSFRNLRVKALGK